MTLDDAFAVARHEAKEFGRTYVVYRLPAWPSDTYSVRAAEPLLPMDADIIARVDPDGSSATATGVRRDRVF